MTEPTTFRLDAAFDALPQGTQGDFILPICMPEPSLLMGKDFAVFVLDTFEGQRVGVPFGRQALTHLQGLVTEALRMLQAEDGDTVQ